MDKDKVYNIMALRELRTQVDTISAQAHESSLQTLGSCVIESNCFILEREYCAYIITHSTYDKHLQCMT